MELNNPNTWSNQSEVFVVPWAIDQNNNLEHTTQDEKKFWTFEKKDPKIGIDKYLLKQVTSTFWILLMCLIWWLFFMRANIITWWSEKNQNRVDIVSSYKETLKNIDNMINVYRIGYYEWLNNISSISDFNEIVTSSLPFFFKRDIIQTLLGQLQSEIIRNDTANREIVQEISKYGYIDSDIMNIMNLTDKQIPIWDSFRVLETIKFETALKLFSTFDTFLQKASQRLWLPKDKVEELMNSYIDHGEEYITQYLYNCYLNPYEILPFCTQINDFENYFIYRQLTDIEFEYFPILFDIIDEELENTDTPSIKIDFNNFDPHADSISFQVTINTLIDDENALLDKGILNPHVFILSTLVNILKKSHFVLGEWINVQWIDIKERNLTIWNIQIPIKTSSMQFRLPLQNAAQREVFDFLEENKFPDIQ